MKILYAEDERQLSMAVSEILKMEGFTVDPVYDGQDALDYLLAGNYDAAILDIMMPKMDGLTVLKKAREAGISIPILMLTAKSEIEDRVAGLDTGADDYLTKPFASQELLARIRAMTRRQPEIRETVLNIGDLSLSRSDYTLSGPEGSFRLANKEYQMMEYLMMHPKTPISTETFLEKIWGYDSESEINVVWVNISGLRKKIAATGSKVQIKVVRGIGYLLGE